MEEEIKESLEEVKQGKVNSIEEVAKEFGEFAKVKAVEKMDARFCIVDEQELIFMVMDDKDVHPTYDVGIWVNTPYFSGAMSNMFNMAWKNMKDVSVASKSL